MNHPEDPRDLTERLEKKERILLKPCTGVGKPRGHVYKAVKESQWNSKDSLGFFTEDEAKRQFGTNVEITQSDTLCDGCLKAIRATIEKPGQKTT